MNALLSALAPGIAPDRLASVFLLVVARAIPLALVAPWWGWKGTLLAARIAATLGLALALTPIALGVSPELPSEWLSLALLAIREVIIGGAFAVAASVPLYALEWAGQLVDRWRGASQRTSPLGTLYAGAGVALFVALGGHRLALAAFAQGLITHPTGSTLAATDTLAFTWGAMRIAGAAIELALAFAAPAALAFVLLEGWLALSGRAAPRIAGWLAAMPLRAAVGIAVALLGLSALLPRLGPVFAEFTSRAGGLFGR